MKKAWEIWKIIEHWIVILWIFSMTIGAGAFYYYGNVYLPSQAALEQKSQVRNDR